MPIKEAVQLTSQALDLLDEAGLGTSAMACHLQMALDTMVDTLGYVPEGLLLAAA